MVENWMFWKDVSRLEHEAIKKIRVVRKKILESLPEKELVAIYIKGSFARREMKEGSDIDIVPIITTNEYRKNIFKLNGEDAQPAIIIPLTIEELKINKLCDEKESETRAKPDRFLRFINEAMLIYGKAIQAKNYPIRDDAQAFLDEKEIVKTCYIPLYEKGSIPFDPLLKEVFWMTEMELLSQGISVNHSFSSIATAVLNPHHIIHDAYPLRLHKPTPKEEKYFVKKLKQWL